ncbi:oxidoreductase, FAD-binding protein [Candidatus Thiomargarita nelsonii]|uniref:Oxidoreductase, FAD-binding protein n=1 Tax=Candidatus Thiomargarita nelsonii TaxID=1003181 RepID=A0A176S6L5_9GAMM|nr:oxidoreductase, FAD-binding protein [Candidatus Thiomargarita nelsonii]
MSQTIQPIHVDITIIGGGIAGLWLLNRLRNLGYNAILFEQKALGGAQTLASQGMIHGGMKYTLGGVLPNISETIAQMPKHWRSCLAGQGDVDLSRAQILSDHVYLWSTASLGSKLTTFFASRAIRGRINAVAKDKIPPVFQNKAFNGKLYRLQEIVVDVPSVVSALAENYREAIFKIDWQHASFVQANEGGVEALQIQHNSQLLSIQSQRFIFAAGEGNENLLQQLSITQPKMQRRPLHQVLVKHDYPHPLYAHCIATSSSPRLTVSSHATSDGKWIWYLGGGLATKGVDQTEPELIATAKEEVKALFSWIDFSQAQWGCLRINRAEPKQGDFMLPDSAYAKSCGNVIVAWPTKLTLSPDLANKVVELLRQEQISPKYPGLSLLAALPRPEVAQAFFELIDLS